MAYDTNEERLKVRGSEQVTRDLKVNRDVFVGGSITAGNSAVLTAADKGIANGVANLDATGRVPYSQLPESAMEYKGTWNADTNTPTLSDGTGTNGDFYVVSVGGTVNFGTVAEPRLVTFEVNDRVIYDSSTGLWTRLQAAGGYVVDDFLQNGDMNAVTSNAVYDAITAITDNYVTGVKGDSENDYRTGNVNIDKANIGLGNVVNTGDSATPASGGTEKFTTGGAYTLKQSIDNKAPKNHASQNTTYGVGTSTNYGHLKTGTSFAFIGQGLSTQPIPDAFIMINNLTISSTTTLQNDDSATTLFGVIIKNGSSPEFVTLTFNSSKKVNLTLPSNSMFIGGKTTAFKASSPIKQWLTKDY